jgi:hypothetical protein
MAADQADRFLNYSVPYYQDSTDRILSPGDTKAEENAWNADLTSLATAMLPNSQHLGLVDAEESRADDLVVSRMIVAYRRPASPARKARSTRTPK